MSRPIRPLNPNLRGGYSERLSNRVPRRNTITEQIKTKDGKIIKRLFKPIKNNTPDKVLYSQTLREFKLKFEKSFGFNIFKTKGENLHVFLPITGMSTSGHLFKGFFEQTLPKARVTFLLTPKTDGFRYDTTGNIEKFRQNLSNNIQRSLNKYDKYFVVFDHVALGTTTEEINNALNKIYNRKTNYLVIPSVEDIGLRIHLKNAEGTKISEIVQKSKLKRIITEHYNAGFELAKNQNIIEELNK